MLVELNEEHTKCSICVNKFSCDRDNKDPEVKKYLPVLSSSQTCDHWFCHGCVLQEQLRVAEENNGRVPKWIRCMHCREKTSFNPAEPKYHRLLIDLLGRAQTYAAAEVKLEQREIESFNTKLGDKRDETVNVKREFDADTEDDEQEQKVKRSKLMTPSPPPLESHAQVQVKEEPVESDDHHRLKTEMTQSSDTADSTNDQLQGGRLGYPASTHQYQGEIRITSDKGATIREMFDIDESDHVIGRLNQGDERYSIDRKSSNKRRRNDKRNPRRNNGGGNKNDKNNVKGGGGRLNVFQKPCPIHKDLQQNHPYGDCIYCPSGKNFLPENAEKFYKKGTAPEWWTKTYERRVLNKENQEQPTQQQYLSQAYQSQPQQGTVYVYYAGHPVVQQRLAQAPPSAPLYYAALPGQIAPSFATGTFAPAGFLESRTE